jgi:hypothetical protein
MRAAAGDCTLGPLGRLRPSRARPRSLMTWAAVSLQSAFTALRPIRRPRTHEPTLCDARALAGVPIRGR